MADVTFPTTLTDGTVLDPVVVDKMVTSGTSGQGLLSEINGHLETANFASTFKVKPELIKPGAVFRHTQTGATDTQDWTDLLFSPNDGTAEGTGDTIPSGSKFVGMPGTGSQVYFPYDMTAAMYRVSIFVTVFRMREFIDQGDIGTPDIFLQLRIDGDVVQSTTCKLPETYRFNDGNNKLFLTDFECLNTRHYDFAYLSIFGADTYCNAGWHKLSLRTRIIPNGGTETLAKPYHTAGDTISYSVEQRLRFGIRNSRIFGYR